MRTCCSTLAYLHPTTESGFYYVTLCVSIRCILSVCPLTPHNPPPHHLHHPYSFLRYCSSFLCPFLSLLESAAVSRCQYAALLSISLQSLLTSTSIFFNKGQKFLSVNGPRAHITQIFIFDPPNSHEQAKERTSCHTHVIRCSTAPLKLAAKL